MVISERTFGVEIEHGGSRNVAMTANSTAFGARAQGLGTDGSGIELRTPILQGEEGFNQLRTCMDYLIQNGNWVSRSDGMHVHLGADDFIGNNRALADLVRSWLNLRPVFERLVSPFRWEREIAEVWTYAKADHIEAGTGGGTPPGASNPYGNYEQPQITFGRANLHLGSVLARTYGRPVSHIPNNTVEWRVHEGCIDFNVAGPYVMTIQGIMDFCVNQGEALKRHRNVKALAKTLEIDGDILENLKKRSKVRTESKRLPPVADIRARANGAPTYPPPPGQPQWNVMNPMTRGFDNHPNQLVRRCNCERCINTRLTRGGELPLTPEEVAAHTTGVLIA